MSDHHPSKGFCIQSNVGDSRGLVYVDVDVGGPRKPAQHCAPIPDDNKVVYSDIGAKATTKQKGALVRLLM